MSRTFRWLCIDARARSWKAWSGVSLCRSMSTPLAWSMTARDSSASCRFSAVLRGVLVGVQVAGRDRGAGPQDPFAGYGPAHGDDPSRGGMGVWLARQLCDHVHVARSAEGTSVRLVTRLT